MNRNATRYNTTPEGHHETFVPISGNRPAFVFHQCRRSEVFKLLDRYRRWSNCQRRLGSRARQQQHVAAAGGKRESILRRDIEELRASARSLMPEGLDRGLKPQDPADLIQFVGDTFR